MIGDDAAIIQRTWKILCKCSNRVIMNTAVLVLKIVTSKWIKLCSDNIRTMIKSRANLLFNSYLNILSYLLKIVKCNLTLRIIICMLSVQNLKWQRVDKQWQYNHKIKMFSFFHFSFSSKKLTSTLKLLNINRRHWRLFLVAVIISKISIYVT